MRHVIMCLKTSKHGSKNKYKKLLNRFVLGQHLDLTHLQLEFVGGNWDLTDGLFEFYTLTKSINKLL